MKIPVFHFLKGRKDFQTVIFLHIPKTAGTSLQQLINRQFSTKLVYELDNRDARKSMEIFQNIPNEEKKQYKVVLGHMWFGLHNFMPQSSTYITILREPIDRVISHYYFVNRRPDHYLYETVKSKNLTLKQYVETKLSTELNNGQTRLLSGEMDEEKYPFGKCSQKMLERAKKNLKKHFSIVGIQEEFDDTLLLIQKILNWKISYIKENVTQNRPWMDEIPKETIELIKNYNRLDIELYNYAQKIFADLKKNHLKDKNGRWTSNKRYL